MDRLYGNTIGIILKVAGMKSMKECPVCQTNHYVESFRPTGNTIKGIGLELSAIAVYLTIPIGKGASVDEAKRLERKADSELNVHKYRCTKCGTEFF